MLRHCIDRRCKGPGGRIYQHRIKDRQGAASGAEEREEKRMAELISVKDRLPGNHATVLIVKELTSGQRSIGFGYCVPECKIHDYSTGEDRAYWVCGGNNVIYWMELPKMPEEVTGDAD